LDSMLANPKVVIDSAGGANMYGQRAGALIPFAGDSTLFVDPIASAFLVIDPSGNVTRVMSIPNGTQAASLAHPNGFGFPSAAAPRPQIDRPKYGEPEVNRVVEDSALVMAMNVKKRSLDTLVRIATGSTVTMRQSYNSTNSQTRTPLFPVFDDWTVMTDGAVA